MSYTLATIVEGHGDVSALPALIRRLEPRFLIPRPIRIPRSQILDNERIERYLRMAAANIREGGGRGGLLILFDADDDCAAKLGRDREAIAQSILDVVCQCVLPVREFEAWIVAGDQSHQERRPPDPESPRDPKRILKNWYGQYTETADQVRLIATADIPESRRTCRSFRRFESALNRFRHAAGLPCSS